MYHILTQCINRQTNIQLTPSKTEAALILEQFCQCTLLVYPKAYTALFWHLFEQGDQVSFSKYFQWDALHRDLLGLHSKSFHLTQPMQHCILARRLFSLKNKKYIYCKIHIMDMGNIIFYEYWNESLINTDLPLEFGISFSGFLNRIHSRINAYSRRVTVI